MRPIYKAKLIQIEVTNVCFRKCSYCTRYCRHLRNDQKYFIPLETLQIAVESLKGFPNAVGIMGGEPTLHPQFSEICKLIKGKFNSVGLFTTGGKRFQKYENLIKGTFDFVHFNPHTPEQDALCRHQPITLAINEIIADKEYREELIDNCPFQNHWSPSVSPKGGFFCEIACAIDRITDGIGGYDLEPRWWMRSKRKFQDQIDRYCKLCGGAVPIDRDFLVSNKEKITPELFEYFKCLNLRRLEDFVAYDKKIEKEEAEKIRPSWDALNFREDIMAFSPYKEPSSCHV